MTEFAQKLNDLLSRQPEKPATIAKVAKISADDISKYKRGKRFPEEKEKVNRLLSAIRCSVAARNEVKNAWEQEYMSRKYKESDAWECIKEIISFLQNESLISEISLCENIDRPCFSGGGTLWKTKCKKICRSFFAR